MIVRIDRSVSSVRRTIGFLAGITLAALSCDRVLAADPVPAVPALQTQDCSGANANAREPATLRAAVAACSAAMRDNALEPGLRAAALLNRGIARRSLGEFGESVADLLAAKQLAPNDPEIARMLGWTWREMGQGEEAEAEYDRALTLEPNWQGFLSRCVVRIGREQYKTALDDCDKVLKETTNEDVLYFSNYARAHLKDYQNAIDSLTVATGGQYASARLFELLASIHETQGRHAEALKVLTLARTKFPNDPSLAQPTKLD